MRNLLAGIRFSVWAEGVRPFHEGRRVISLHTSKRPIGETFAAIRRDQTENADVIAAFHKVWYGSRQTHGMTFYEQVPVLKNPLDLWIYQEIIWELRPTLIIETGTAYGGSALYFARQLDRVGEGQVMSIDLEPADALPEHPRISFVRGYSSVLPELVSQVAAVAKEHPRVMVVLDSDHSKRHVLQELEAYAPLVTLGQFLVVEDTNINGRPVETDWMNGPGPGPAVDEWLPKHPAFEVAIMAERYLLTHNPQGWLRRIETDASV